MRTVFLGPIADIRPRSMPRSRRPESGEEEESSRDTPALRVKPLEGQTTGSRRVADTAPVIDTEEFKPSDDIVLRAPKKSVARQQQGMEKQQNQ